MQWIARKLWTNHKKERSKKIFYDYESACQTTYSRKHRWCVLYARSWKKYSFGSFFLLNFIYNVRFAHVIIYANDIVFVLVWSDQCASLCQNICRRSWKNRIFHLNCCLHLKTNILLFDIQFFFLVIYLTVEHSFLKSGFE